MPEAGAAAARRVARRAGARRAAPGRPARPTAGSPASRTPAECAEGRRGRSRPRPTRRAATIDPEHFGAMVVLRARPRSPTRSRELARERATRTSTRPSVVPVGLDALRDAPRGVRRASASRSSCSCRSASRDRLGRRARRRSPTPPSTSTDTDPFDPAVVHAGVLHPQDVGVLVLEEAAVDDLADEERVVAGVEPLAHLAVEVGDRLGEDRRAGDALDVREPVERPGVEVDVDRLGELAHDRAVLTVDQAEAEHPARLDQLVGERGLLDADADPLGVERDLGRPVDASCRCAARAVGASRPRRGPHGIFHSSAAASGRTRRGSRRCRPRSAGTEPTGPVPPGFAMAVRVRAATRPASVGCPRGGAPGRPGRDGLRLGRLPRRPRVARRRRRSTCSSSRSAPRSSAPVIALLVGAEVEGSDLAFGVVAGVCSAVGLGLLYRGLATGRMGVVAPVTAVVAAVIPIAGASHTGERPVDATLVGVVVAVARRATSLGARLRRRAAHDRHRSAYSWPSAPGRCSGSRSSASPDADESGYWPVLMAPSAAVMVLGVTVSSIRSDFRLDHLPRTPTVDHFADRTRVRSTSSRRRCSPQFAGPDRGGGPGLRRDRAAFTVIWAWAY